MFTIAFPKYPLVRNALIFMMLRIRDKAMPTRVIIKVPNV